MAVPSSQAFVSPSSTEIAAAIASEPSFPDGDRDITRVRSIVSARMYRLPPTSNTASSVTRALVSETMIPKAKPTAIRLTAVLSLTTSNQ